MRRLIAVLLLALPLSGDSLRVSGLRESVTVIRDKWGVPHIYASNQHDLFFAQGYVQAQDRLYQMEVWKRAGQGRLAEVLGPAFVGRDIVARKLRYRGSMEKEYASYATDTKEILEAFTSGINAYIRDHQTDPPVEFRLAGFDPTTWKPEDCLQRMAAYGLMSNASGELRNARLLAEFGVEKATSLIAPDPFARLDPSPSIDYASLDIEMLREFIGSDIRIEMPPPGSNNWVVAGSMTASGKPLLANDPHRTLSIPSLRYIVHLVAPGWNVIGAVEPALPGVGIGHNDSIAWGITVFGADQQDLYVETIRDDGKYKTEDGWKSVRVEHEQIKVKGGETVDATIEFTRHGPVVWKKGAHAVSLRWVGSEPGTAGYMGALTLDRAKNWSEFREALKRWKVPGENIVYADRSGHIGEQSAALTPRRSWTGMLPVDGSGGKYEWKGFLPLDELPHSLDPQRGYIATANDRTIAKDDPRHIAHQWASPFRIDRINEVLRHASNLTADDMGALQNDVSSLAARQFLMLLRKSGAEGEAASMLRAWDGTVTTDSAAAALYEVWIRTMRSDYAKSIAPANRVTLVEGSLGTEGTLRAVTAMPDAQQREFITSTLSRAWDADSQKRRWGAVHVARFRHGLDKRGDAAVLDPPPVERPGDGDTVHAAGWRAPFEQVHGATFREIIDLSSWDRSLAINSPGQSGTPGSAHYADLLPLWARGDYFPLVFSREAVEANAESRTTLQP